MNKFDRIQQLHALFTSRKTSVSMTELMDSLECSEASVKRLIGKFRHELGAPIRYDSDSNGYILDFDEERRYEIPGLWFTIEELHALLTIQEMLATLQPGLLKRELSSIRRRIEKILNIAGAGQPAVSERLRYITVTGRKIVSDHFTTTATATLGRRKIRVRYHSRSKDAVSERILSPQRLIHYRQNWYLDAWCHSCFGIRTFSLDRFRRVDTLNEAAEEISGEQLDSYFTPSYGLFAGEAVSKAVLKFTPERARWVAEEEWHPDQQGDWSADGSYILSLPYSNHRELLLDILKFGPDVEVLSPPELREEVKKRLQRALQQYS